MQNILGPPIFTVGKQLFTMSKLPIFYILVTILLTSVSQLLQKQAAIELGRAHESKPLLSNISFVLSGMFLGASLITWLLVLKHFDVSIAYPILSLNYVVVLIFAKLCFNEKIPSRRWLGVGCIIAGVAVLSKGNI